MFNCFTTPRYFVQLCSQHREILFNCVHNTGKCCSILFTEVLWNFVNNIEIFSNCSRDFVHLCSQHRKIVFYFVRNTKIADIFWFYWLRQKQAKFHPCWEHNRHLNKIGANFCYNVSLRSLDFIHCINIKFVLTNVTPFHPCWQHIWTKLIDTFC